MRIVFGHPNIPLNAHCAFFGSFVKIMNIYEMEFRLNLHFRMKIGCICGFCYWIYHSHCKLNKHDRKTIKSVIRFTNCVQLQFSKQSPISCSRSIFGWDRRCTWGSIYSSIYELHMWILNEWENIYRKLISFANWFFAVRLVGFSMAAIVNAMRLHILFIYMRYKSN